MIVTWLNHRMSGYLFVEMTGFSPARFFNMCSVHEIEIWGVSDTGRSCRFYMTVKGFKKIKPIVRKSKVRLKVLGKFGLPFFYTETGSGSFTRPDWHLFLSCFTYFPSLSGILSLRGITCIRMIPF